MRTRQSRVAGCTAASAAVLLTALFHAWPASAGEATAEAGAVPVNAARCSALNGRQLGGGTVNKTEWLPGGTPVSILNQKIAKDVCRVSAHITSAPDSEIKIRVWLPSNWNGKMYGSGGGGFNGGMSADGIILSRTVNKGYAAVSTDAGHDVADGAAWALNHPQKIIDFGNKANHLGAIATKAIVAAFYGYPAKRSYFQGCSNGGRDALILAQRYPDDYDAIIAGAPANDWSGLMSSFGRAGLVTRLFTDGTALAPKLKLLHEAVLKQCDSADGARDGLVSNPSSCKFNPAVLECKGGLDASCLAKPEVAAFKAIYQGARTRDGRTVMPGFPPGSELGWAAWFAAPNGSAPTMAQEYFRYMVYGDAKWDRTTFVLDRDYPVAKGRTASALDATETNLSPFLSRGGKLLMYHGWEDPAIPAGSSIRYYEAARRSAGARADQMRLIMVPGMEHCGGGEGPTYVDWLSALERWDEANKPPERLIATRFDDPKLAALGMGKSVLGTRPVCAWPKTPRYSGSGSVDQEDRFICR